MKQEFWKSESDKNGSCYYIFLLITKDEGSHISDSQLFEKSLFVDIVNFLHFLDFLFLSKKSIKQNMICMIIQLLK